MNHGLKTKIPVIVGPTASGKTALSVALAKITSGEIVSADSRQIYTHMDIGTDKPGKELRASIPHHFIDIKLPSEYYTAGEFGREAELQVKTILQNGHLPIVVGGSGLYLRALTDGLFGPKVSDLKVKQDLQKRVEKEGLDTLYHYLQKVDQITANRLHPNDAQRIIRALEVYQISGLPLSKHHSAQQRKNKLNWYFIGLRWPREVLYKRIEDRIDIMIQKGLVDEVRQLRSMGFTSELNSLQTVGYQEIFDVLDNTINLEVAINEIKKNSRRYAKRQITWFGRDERINWYDIDAEFNISATAKIIKNRIRIDR